MKLPSLFYRLVSTGTEGLASKQKQRVHIINSLSLTTAVLAFVMGAALYLAIGQLSIFIPSMVESLGFLGIIWLNKKRWYEPASISMLAWQAIWAVYFGVLLGASVEVVLVLLFMISAIFLLYKKRRSIIICLGVTIAGLLIIEFFYFTGWIKPLTFQHTTTFLLRWCCILFILTMNTLCILFYQRANNNLLRTLRTRTSELEKAHQSRRVFLQETSHEIRNPLNAIFGIVQLMRMDQKKGTLKESLPELIESLYVASFNVKDIINNVLELSRIEAMQLDTLQWRQVLIRSMLRNIAGIYEYVASAKSVHIDLKFEERLPEKVITDETKLSQIINNLLTNAIKFTRPNTIIHIRASAQEDTWQISITDQGGGIEEEKLKRIFMPFVSEKNTFVEGTGLGLYISKHFAKLLRGHISVSCKEGSGTTFTVTFPITALREQTMQPIVNGRASENDIRKTVLVIEDDRMNQAILKNFLAGNGMQVMTAGNGLEGLNAAREQAPDLIILDSHMPKMNGRETLQHLKTDPSLQHIPVIIASGDAFTETANVFLREGASEYVIKPIEFTALKLVLEKYLSGSDQLHG